MDKPTTVRVHIAMPSGERVRTCHGRRFACPLCGTELQLKRSKISEFMEDAAGTPVNVFKRTYYCPSCEFKLHSQVWRPYGENPCCQQQLSHLNPSMTKIVDMWVERDGNLTIYRKREAFACTCGIYYEWPEGAVIPFDRGADAGGNDEPV